MTEADKERQTDGQIFVERDRDRETERKMGRVRARERERERGLVQRYYGCQRGVAYSPIMQVLWEAAVRSR